MANKIYSATYYDAEGAPRTFEVFSRELENGAPIVTLMDGAFLATADTLHEAQEEIQDAVEWFGLAAICPVWA